MKKIKATFIMIIIASFALAQTGSITNISPAQRTDGSMIIDIAYDLTGPEPDYYITVEASFDGGVNYNPADSVSGDAGAGIIPGTGKQIVWKFGAEYPGTYSNQMQIRLTASQVLPWSCGDPFTDSRDSQTYTSVEIGTQCWMAESLNIGTMISGSSSQSNNSTIEKYCYSNSTANCDEYGGLYQWNEMMQYSTTPGTQCICPDGWHLPTDAEWCALEQEVDPTITCSSTGWRGVDGGGKLKEAGTTHWLSPNTGATNSSGFTALPGGYRDTNGSFLNLTYHANFWSSSENGSNAWYRNLYYNNAQVYRYSYDKSSGFSVRCLRDNPTTWSCGDPLQVTHTAGDVSPVNKTVNYGTVETNLTGTNQCWITQNLGSDQQASSAADATEASAGWYWRFNRKQGYKHDGTTRTPNTAWIASIDENTDWETANDPCTILLGAGWRMPTYTEWYNADQNGGWNNRDDTYNSVLKLHAAGYLNYSNGSLSIRGAYGHYWSSTQANTTNGWTLSFSISHSYMGHGNKAYGFSARCLRD